MSKFIIAAAQASSTKCDVDANIRTHSKFVNVAIECGVDAIVFPELSLTGYEPETAKDITINIDDERLDSLKKLAQRSGITIIVGAPIESSSEKPCIGAFVLNPDNSFTYIKNHLHPGEEVYFSSGVGKNSVMNIKDEIVGLAICEDVNHASHAKAAAEDGASVYAASVLMMGGYAIAAQHLQQYAIEHSMAVLMANHGSSTGGYMSAGKSAVWDNKGRLLAVAGETGNALVVATKDQNGWAGKAMAI